MKREVPEIDRVVDFSGAFLKIFFLPCAMCVRSGKDLSGGADAHRVVPGASVTLSASA